MNTYNDGLDKVIKHCKEKVLKHKDNLKFVSMNNKNNVLIIRLVFKKSYRFDILIPQTMGEITVVERKRNKNVVVINDYKFVSKKNYIVSSIDDINAIIDIIVEDNIDKEVIEIIKPIWVEYDPEKEIENNEVFFGKVIEIKCLNSGSLTDGYYLYQIKLQTETGVWSKVLSIYSEIKPTVNAYILFDKNNFCTFVQEKPSNS